VLEYRHWKKDVALAPPATAAAAQAAANGAEMAGHLYPVLTVVFDTQLPCEKTVPAAQAFAGVE